MVASAIYIMDLKGKIIISRDYRGDIPLSATVKFNQRLQESENELTPVFSIDGITYIFVRESNLMLLAVAKRNSNITVILLFLSHILRVMTDYFGEVTEETIRDNFVITYELLDEMMDYGYPQSTESKILKEYVTLPRTQTSVSAIVVDARVAVDNTKTMAVWSSSVPPRRRPTSPQCHIYVVCCFSVVS